MPAIPATDFTIRTRRLRFFCRKFGVDDGIPLLLLHGSYATSRWWERFCAELPAEIYAVAPDLRGCGQSDKPERGYTVEELAEDVDALADALQWDTFHLMAHASSGAVAIEYALQHGHHLDTLTLVDTVPIEGVFTPLDGYVLLEQMRTDHALLGEALRVLMPGLILDDDHPDNLRFFEQLVDDAAQMAPAAFTEIARGLAQWNRFGDARQLTIPTLLVWGALDQIVARAETTRTLIAIPGADNLEIIHDAGHCPMIEAPAVLAARWIDFLVQDHMGYDAVRRSASSTDQSEGN